MLSNITEIKNKRIELNLTQAELADTIGLHPSAVSRIESGKTDCMVSTLELLGDGLRTIEDARRRKLAGMVIISKTDFENAMYKSIIQELEQLEHKGKYQGNGHHLAQRLIGMISREVGAGNDQSAIKKAI